MYVAAKAGHDEAVRALLEVPATKVNWQNHKGLFHLPVLLGVRYSGRIDIFLSLSHWILGFLFMWMVRLEEALRISGGKWNTVFRCARTHICM